MARDDGMSAADAALKLGRPNMSYREISEIMGISKTAVQNIERRALRKLRRRLGEMGYSTYMEFMEKTISRRRSPGE